MVDQTNAPGLVLFCNRVPTFTVDVSSPNPAWFQSEPPVWIERPERTQRSSDASALADHPGKRTVCSPVLVRKAVHPGFEPRRPVVSFRSSVGQREGAADEGSREPGSSARPGKNRRRVPPWTISQQSFAAQLSHQLWSKLAAHARWPIRQPKPPQASTWAAVVKPLVRVI